MQRAKVTVQGAPSYAPGTTRRDPHDHYGSGRTSPDSSDALESNDSSIMQSNGHHPYYDSQHDRPQSPYDYEGSGYSSPPSSRNSSAQYGGNAVQRYGKPAPAQVNNLYDDFDFGSPIEEEPRGPTFQPSANGDHFEEFRFDPRMDEQMTSHHIDLNPHDPNHGGDAMGRHLLYETALLDTQSYEILDIHEVDELKKEHTRLNQRIDAANRKLALESKVKDAAQNLQRLYSSKKENRPDTPQSPESPKRARNSLLGGKGRPGSSGGPGAQTLHQAEDELAQSIKTVDDLNEQIKSLLDRRQTVERKLLRHTAAVLAAQVNQSPEHQAHNLTNGHDDDHDESHQPEVNEFDDIRDILRGFPAPASKMKEDHEKQLQSMQSRLEQLNSKLRGVITEASRSRGTDPAPEPQVTRSQDTNDRLENAFTLMESNLRALEQERADSHSQSDMEKQLAGLNRQLHDALQTSSDTGALSQPPQVTGQGCRHQLHYLEENLSTIGDLLKKHGEEMQRAQEASGGKTTTHAQKFSEYETVLAGLWDIVAADGPSGAMQRGSTDESARSSRGDKSPSLKEDFSIQAFSSRVQHLHDVASGAREQQDILRRQIQQQRDLNGKADMEKRAEVDEVQARYDKLAAAHTAMQDELAKSMADHQHSQQEAGESRDEMANVMNELEQLRRTVDEAHARQKEVDQRSVETTSEREDALQRCNELQADMENMESEVVRLTTELTIAKADLEGAYGTRKERQKEAGMAAGEIDALQKLKDQEIEDLKKAHAERIKTLETELQGMTNDFQDMTRESLELEKERGALESLIDGLRDRSDSLEAQLNDEKMKWMGIKSPGGSQEQNMPRETMSVMVLRQEFKKMMRETRTEGVRLIRAEQEERRKLESELRKIRQTNHPLGRALGLSPSTVTPTANSPSASTLNPSSAVVTG